MPPLEGPRATLCVTRKPSKTWVPPSSIRTGIETATDFLHSWRTLTRLASMSKTSATRRSCSRAIWNGFSRRCDSGASTDVTGRSFAGCWKKALFARRKRAEYTPSSDPERDRAGGRGAGLGRLRDHAELVQAACQARAGGAAAGEPELEAAGQHVAEASEQAEPHAARIPERDVEALERPDRVAADAADDAAGAEREQRGRPVGRVE